ncbi:MULTISPECIES: THUMP domain-containing class I SAM-dependent RNA methyltransferase [Marinovum]|uniref:THUMP domain-containing class I SAM-dependent RNA methyltransferase n=1 Tax=Marinovum TaxID=367771 RepID=UPI00237BBC30|nr:MULTISPECIES: class I SAM-dependent RNA methyltransferase [Marinovum]MDD9742079.1 class I SAM-dependent RNA methyltransferase [Marinovum sp. SP66]
MSDSFEIFLACPPGLEPLLRDEAREAGFAAPACTPGGVTFRGGWPEVWRANLVLRGASRVLARIGEFRALHLAQLDKRARKMDWRAVLRADVPVKVEATCRKSRIYHAKAATQRVEGALEAAGIALGAEAELVLRVRIEDDLCTFSVDTSGALLHKRGFKTGTGKAPMRETLAALFLRGAGFDGSAPVVDPMCGSGTFVIEAAEMAMGLAPGRGRSFAFERLASFDADAWAAMRAAVTPRETPLVFHGSDRNEGAIANARENAARAGVDQIARFRHHAISDLSPPDGPKGLVIANPPYGGRIGNKKLLYGLYGSFGQVLKQRFAGWHVGVVTSEAGLARATGLKLEPGPVVDHGGIRVRLYQGRIAG